MAGEEGPNMKIFDLHGLGRDRYALFFMEFLFLQAKIRSFW